MGFFPDSWVRVFRQGFPIFGCGPLFIVMVAHVIPQKLKKFDQLGSLVGLYYVSIALAVVSAFLLAFAIYAWFFNPHRCAKCIFWLIIIVISCMFPMTVLYFLFESVIEGTIRSAYEYEDRWNVVVEAFGCCSLPDSWYKCKDESQSACGPSVEAYSHKFCTTFCGLFGAVSALFVLLLIYTSCTQDYTADAGGCFRKNKEAQTQEDGDERFAYKEALM